MYHHYDSRFEKDVTIIHPGEYFSTADDIIISTVLGSCVAVALYDPALSMGGLNHFMLSGELRSGNFTQEESGRYGMYAMELLINQMLKNGANKKRLQAKVFGGGHVLSTPTRGNVADSNVIFALKFLETEQIPILSRDVGGDDARKVLFFPTTFRVLMKRIGKQKAAPIEREELSYLDRLANKPKKSTGTEGVTFFN